MGENKCWKLFHNVVTHFITNIYDQLFIDFLNIKSNCYFFNTFNIVNWKPSKTSGDMKRYFDNVYWTYWMMGT